MNLNEKTTTVLAKLTDKALASAMGTWLADHASGMDFVGWCEKKVGRKITEDERLVLAEAMRAEWG